MQLRLYRDEPGSGRLARQFQTDDVLARLRALDTRILRKGLDSLDPSKNSLIGLGMEIDAAGRVTKNSYGVLNLSWRAADHPQWAAHIEAEVADIRQRIRGTHRVPLQFVIWAGMGGSAEDKSMYNAAGLLKRGPRLYVLDSTDPAKLKSILEDVVRRSRQPLGEALKRTLVVGMAMGMTSYEPVVNLEKIAALYDSAKVDSRSNFIYMTLPGSLLDQFAAARGYRRVELQPDSLNTTAGRHSAPMTRGSLYPLCLAGVDLTSWMAATRLNDDDIHTAWQLAAFLQAQGSAGRDKLTLALPKEWLGAALWTKQNFEESLGKSEDIGIKVVIGEKLKMPNYRAPRDPAQDRVFLSVQVKAGGNTDARKIELIRHAGYPVAVLTFPARSSLAAYMQFVHYVVFGLAYLRQMNFVTQPSVELYKSITNKLHAAAGRAGGIEQSREWKAYKETDRQARWRGSLTLRWDRLTGERQDAGTSAPAIYAAMIRAAFSDRACRYAEFSFFGDTRYSPRGRAVRAALDRGAERIFRSQLRAPVDIYEGPAMNHSYHEMIIGHGRCFSTVLLSEAGERIAAADYGPDYHRAQFLATQMALAQRNRRVVSITLKNLDERTVVALDEFFAQTARHLKEANG